MFLFSEYETHFLSLHKLNIKLGSESVSEDTRALGQAHKRPPPSPAQLLLSLSQKLRCGQMVHPCMKLSRKESVTRVIVGFISHQTHVEGSIKNREAAIQNRDIWLKNDVITSTIHPLEKTLSKSNLAADLNLEIFGS